MVNPSAIAFPSHLVIINTRHNVNNPQHIFVYARVHVRMCVSCTLFHFEITSVFCQGVAWTGSLPALQTGSIALLHNDKYLMCLTVCMQNKRLCQKCSRITQAYRNHHMRRNACVHTHTHTYRNRITLCLSFSHWI